MFDFDGDTWVHGGMLAGALLVLAVVLLQAVPVPDGVLNVAAVLTGLLLGMVVYWWMRSRHGG